MQLFTESTVMQNTKKTENLNELLSKADWTVLKPVPRALILAPTSPAHYSLTYSWSGKAVAQKYHQWRKTLTEASAEPDPTRKVDLAWTHWLLRKHCQASTPVDVTWPHRKRTTKEHLEKRCGEDVDSRIQGKGWRKWRWQQHRTELKMEKSGLWQPMFHTATRHKPIKSFLHC